MKKHFTLNDVHELTSLNELQIARALNRTGYLGVFTCRDVKFIDFYLTTVLGEEILMANYSVTLAEYGSDLTTEPEQCNLYLHKEENGFKADF